MEENERQPENYKQQKEGPGVVFIKRKSCPPRASVSPRKNAHREPQSILLFLFFLIFKVVASIRLRSNFKQSFAVLLSPRFAFRDGLGDEVHRDAGEGEYGR